MALQLLSRSDIWHFYSHSTGQFNLGISRARIYNLASGAKQEEKYEYLSNINKTYQRYELTCNKYINFVFRLFWILFRCQIYHFLKTVYLWILFLVDCLNHLLRRTYLFLLIQWSFHFLLIRVPEMTFANYISPILGTWILDGVTPVTPSLVHVTLTWLKEHKYLIATMWHMLVQTMQFDHTDHTDSYQLKHQF